MATWVGLAAQAPAADRFEDQIPVPPGGTLRVRLDVGSVEIESDDEHEVRVEASYSGSMEFELRSDGRDVELEGRKEGLFGLLGPRRVRVRVRVPERFSVDVETQGGSIGLEDIGGSVVARTSGGSIELDGALGPAELRSSGGTVEAHDVEGAVQANTSGGRITISEARGPVEAETSGGGLRIHDVGGPVRARTSGGSISVRFEERPEGEIETSGGSIEAELPEDMGVDLEARTSGGRVEIDAPVLMQGAMSQSHVRGQLFGGGPSLRLETSGGNIRVRVR
ncbi:MAG: DUF4097 family beta strand repeat-containing protein [Myxococcota bacterium]